MAVRVTGGRVPNWATALACVAALGCSGDDVGAAPNPATYGPPALVVTAGEGAGVAMPEGPGGASIPVADARGGSNAPVTDPVAPSCDVAPPARAPIRRLSRFEYNNTVAGLLGDDSAPADTLPAELLGNGFGNDADQQPVSAFLVEQYGAIAEGIANRAVEARHVVEKYAPCYATVTSATEDACARTFIEGFVRRAYRRPPEPAEVDDLLALERSIRATATLETSFASVIEAVLQGPDFLYRPEFGVDDANIRGAMRPTGHEMATRLSYLLWGTAPDDELSAAAESGELLTNDRIMAQANRMLADPRSRAQVRFFFDSYLPLNTLTDLARDATLYPGFSTSIGKLMREETQRFLAHVIFEGPGTWPAALTAPYTFVNGPLADFYGIEGVVGDDFRKVDLDTTQRLGVLTQGGILAGTTVSNFTNPVRRGVFLLRHVMCLSLPDPPESFANDIKPPDPDAAATGRQRYSQHSQDPACSGCHAVMDPPGFALENFDAVGRWRDEENDVAIDASGSLNVLSGPFNGPVELVTLIAESEATQDCFASQWLAFGYGRALEFEDACTTESVQRAFADSGYDVQKLLLALTQTNAFLYLSPEGRP